MKVVVKICGLTRPKDAACAVAAGADWLGLNFWPGSRRCIDAARGAEIAAAARQEAQAGPAARRPLCLIGVFVNQPADEIADLARRLGLDHVQLHGDETPAMCAALVDAGLSVIKAVALGAARDVARLGAYPGALALVDTPTPGYGGSGQVHDWDLARAAVAAGKQILLAGGLHAGNVARAVAEVAPFGVDVASGVESAPGIKDPERVRAFVAAARGENV